MRENWKKKRILTKKKRNWVNCRLLCNYYSQIVLCQLDSGWNDMRNNNGSEVYLCFICGPGLSGASQMLGHGSTASYVLNLSVLIIKLWARYYYRETGVTWFKDTQIWQSWGLNLRGQKLLNWGIGRIRGENLSVKGKEACWTYFDKNSRYDIIAFMYYSTI